MAGQFVEELKTMVDELVRQVLSDNTPCRLSAFASPASAPQQAQPAPTKQADEAPKAPRKRIVRAGSICPQCGQGKVIKGHTAYGCSRWKEGCDWRKPFK